jgi:hypothetical protein
VLRRRIRGLGFGGDGLSGMSEGLEVLGEEGEWRFWVRLG